MSPRYIGEKLSAQELDQMIQEADADGDGKINYQEFTEMLLVSGGKDRGVAL